MTKQTSTNKESTKKPMGEGNREADQRYREKTQDFVKSGKVDDAAKKAREQDPKEAKQAEEKGKARAKEFDKRSQRDHEKV